MNYKFETVQKDNGVDLVCSAVVDKKGNFIPDSEQIKEWKDGKNPHLEIITGRRFPNGIFTEEDKQEMVYMCEKQRQLLVEGKLEQYK